MCLSVTPISLGARSHALCAGLSSSTTARYINYDPTYLKALEDGMLDAAIRKAAAEAEKASADEKAKTAAAKKAEADAKDKGRKASKAGEEGRCCQGSAGQRRKQEARSCW
jgi:hypothetical protein